MERFNVGEKVPLVTSPSGSPASGSVRRRDGAHGLMTAQHAALLEHQPDQTSPPAARARSERLASDELALLGLESDRPGEARFEGMARLVHVVAVEIHAGLQAQRVARAESGRPHALRDQRAPGLGSIRHPAA